MPIVALCGLRGGVGTTSVAASLAWALHSLGERTIVIDFSPCNQLRMHFNTPWSHLRGWAHSALQQQPWQQSAMRYAGQLDFIPFGQLTRDEMQAYICQPEQLLAAWQAQLAELQASYRWIVLDIPADMPRIARLILPLADQRIVVLNPDANCHLRLHQSLLATGCRFLINQFNPVSKVQQDLHQLWLGSLPSLVPLLIHRDEAMAEALMSKQPVAEYRPASLAAEEMTTLATWCLMHLGETE